MASEALEEIVGTAPTFERTGLYTTIDVYAAGTAALYWGPNREEEEMFMMEEQRRMESKMEIESAITAQYSDAPQAPQWSLDQPSYGTEKIDYSFGPDIGVEPMQSHDTGYSFTTYIEPEPVTSMEELNNWKSSQIPEPEPTIHSLHIDGVDYSQLINSLPEPTRLSSPGGMGWGFEMKLEPPIAPIDPLRGIGHMDKPDTGFNPFRSSLEDTHYGSSEKPYIPTTRSTWDMDLMPKPEPVDYTSPVSNIMNRIGMPELDLKPKSYLPPSLGHLQGMNHVPEPDTGFQLYGLSGTSPLMAKKEAKRMLETKKMLEEMEKPLAFLQLGINSLPEPEPDTPSGFIPYQDPTRTMLDIMEKTRHGSIFGLDSEPKSYLSSLKNQLSMYIMPGPEPDDMPTVRDIMKVTVPKFDFSGYMNTVPEPEPVIPVRPVLPFMEDAKPSVQEIMDSLNIHKTPFVEDEPPVSSLGLTKDTYPYNLMGDEYNPMEALSAVRNKFGHFLADKEENDPGDFSFLHPNEDNSIYKDITRIKKREEDSWWMTQYNNGEVAVHGHDKHSGKSSHPSNVHIDVGKNHFTGYKLSVERSGDEDDGRKKILKDLWPIFER